MQRNGLFISPGVKVHEIDQSIVPDLYLNGRHTVLIFFLSDWGPQNYVIKWGTKEFQRTFGIPKGINEIKDVSFDQQYRLSPRFCDLLCFRLNYSSNPTDIQDYELDVDMNTYVPISQLYSGEFGNKLLLKFYLVRGTIFACDVYIQENYLTEPKLMETFTGRSIEQLIEFANQTSNYIRLSEQDLTPDVFAELVTRSNTDLLQLQNGQNGSRIDPTSLITEDLLMNPYEYKFHFLVTQGQLSSEEINDFIDLQYMRKDFIILSEFMPEDDSIGNDDVVQQDGSPILGWEKWSRQVNNNIGTKDYGYTYRYKTGLEQSYLQVYHPWVIDSTANYDNLIPYPPSVHAVETFLRVIERGGMIWEQMAGLNRGDLSREPLIILSKFEGDNLYLSSINPIVKFQGQGTFIWGQKTHYMRNSQLSRINQRMVQIHIEMTIQDRMRRFLFEPMIESTFQAISNSITMFMEEVRNQHGIIDYQFELDIRPEFIERNYLPIKIRFIPVKQLEFIEIRFVVKNYSQTL